MNAPAQPDFAKRVEQYVALRDEIKRRDQAHKDAMRPFRETLEKLNSALLAGLEAVNSDSVRTSNGTVYRTKKQSASITDMTAFWAFVVTQGNWDLVDKRANSTAVSDYIAEQVEAAKTDPNITPGPPPGVNFTTTFVAGVRRA